MALINCKKCGKEVSNLEPSCPYCGEPIEKPVGQVNVNIVKEKGKWSTGLLVIGIVSIIMFLLITLQSCAAGISNTLSQTGETSGSTGFLVAILMLVAGIITVVTRNSVKASGKIVAASFYYFAGLIGSVLAESYGDLEVWAFISICFGVVLMYASLSKKKVALIVTMSIGALLILVNLLPSSPIAENASTPETENVIAEEDSIVTEQATSSDEDGIIDFSTDSFALKYDKFEITKDYEDNDCVIVYFTFTNNIEKAMSFDSAIYVQAFQNGIECDNTYLMDDVKEYLNGSKDVKKDTSISVCSIFKIDDMSDLELNAAESFSFNDKIGTQIINLK